MYVYNFTILKILNFNLNSTAQDEAKYIKMQMNDFEYYQNYMKTRYIS